MTYSTCTECKDPSFGIQISRPSFNWKHERSTKQKYSDRTDMNWPIGTWRVISNPPQLVSYRSIQVQYISNFFRCSQREIIINKSLAPLGFKTAINLDKFIANSLWRNCHVKAEGCRRLLSLCIVKRVLWYYHLSHDEDLKTVVLTLHVLFKCWTLRKFTWRICINLLWIDRVKLDWAPLYWEHSFMGLATWDYFLYLVQYWHRLLPLSCTCCPKRSVPSSTCKHQQDDHQGDEH